MPFGRNQFGVPSCKPVKPSQPKREINIPPEKRSRGRPKGSRNKIPSEIKAAAREYTPEALQRLVYWMRSRYAGASINACKEILDRGHGKAIQPLHHEGEIHVTHEEAISIIATRVAEIKAREDLLN